MNIVYILSGTTVYGGATKSFISLVKGVCGAGNKALVICPNKDGIYELISKGAIPGVDAHYIDYTYNILPFIKSPKDILLFLPRLLKRVIKNRIASRKLVDICKKFKPDLIHSNTSVNNLGYLTARHLNIPHIWHIREYGWADFKMRVPFQGRMLRSTRNYTISITKDINKSKSLDHSPNSTVIYNGIISVDNIRYSKDYEKCFLYVGRVTERKGALSLLRAYCDYVKFKPIELWKLKYVGSFDNSCMEQLSSICRINDLAHYVEFTGAIDNVNDLMYKSGVVVVPSFFEGFGRVLPEAMANGCLTIARNSGGSKEQYDNGLELTGREIGLRFDDEEELTGILMEVSSKGKNYYEDMIIDSQKTITRFYTVETYCKDVLDFYQKILNGKLCV